jgi:hypothetical protein
MVQECNIYSSKGTSKTPEKRLNTRQQRRVEMGEEKMGKGGERGTGERGRESPHIRLKEGRDRKGIRARRTAGCKCTHKNLLEGSMRPGCFTRRAGGPSPCPQVASVPQKGKIWKRNAKECENQRENPEMKL